MNRKSAVPGTRIAFDDLARALLAMACASSAAIASEDGSEHVEPAELSPIVVVATKSPRPLADVAGTVSIIDADAIADQLAGGIGDLVRYQPGISAPRQTTRFGRSGYTLRGIGGNRVAIEIDGVPIADRFDIGSFSNAGRDLVDVNLIERIEILRGPASTLYGSDAIGGVVSYYTHDPEDLVPAYGQGQLGGSAGFLGADQSAFVSVRGAWAQPGFGVLGSVTHRDGHQLDAAAAALEDHQDYESSSAFAKGSWTPSPGHTLTASLDHFERAALTDIGSVLGTGRFASTTRLSGDDQQRRDRVSLNYDFASGLPWATEGRMVLYGQRAETVQRTLEERAARDIRRQREFDYSQEVVGLKTDFSTALSLWGGEHRVGYGVALTRTETRELRDALQSDLAGGAPTRTLLGETFPVRDFPNSRTLEAGAYLHDEVVFGDGRWTWIPAVRWDYYELDPRPDSIYRADNPDTGVVSVSEHKLSPKLGFTVDLGAGWSAFGQYAHGFRAPPFEDANIGLDIPLFNIRAIPNPDLVSERSRGVELGLRYFAPGTSLALAAHYTDYDDFIETKARLGIDPETGVILFQSRNIESARIYGAELLLEQDLGAWIEALAAFDLSVGFAWTRGEDEQSGEELGGVDPPEAIAALRWEAPSRAFSATLSATLVGSKRGLDEPPEEQFRPAGYAVADLSANYRIRPALTVRAGLFNLTNKTYWRWADVQGLGEGDPLLPVLSNPGRYAAVSLSLNW